MAACWRSVFQLGPLPFYIVEIAPYAYGGSGYGGALLREAQYRAQRSIYNSQIITTNDLVTPAEKGIVHPSNKKSIGQRLAFSALNHQFGYSSILSDCPVFEKFDVHNHRLYLYFTNDRGGFSPKKDMVGFEVANNTHGPFLKARAVRNERNRREVVEVWVPGLPNPIAVRYCFGDFLLGNVQSMRQLPVYPFRSDDWHVSTGLSEFRDYDAMLDSGRDDVNEQL
jgi:sialate O-acetylesterase